MVDTRGQRPAAPGPHVAPLLLCSSFPVTLTKSNVKMNHDGYFHAHRCGLEVILTFIDCENAQPAPEKHYLFQQVVILSGNWMTLRRYRCALCSGLRVDCCTWQEGRLTLRWTSAKIQYCYCMFYS